MIKGYEGGKKKSEAGREGIWQKNLMLEENEIKSETDEWTAGPRNEVIQREMKGEREEEHFWENEGIER